MISFTQALKLGTTLPRTNRTHKIKLFNAHNTILSQDIFASRAIPAFDNSAMDGYAILLQDYDKTCINRGKILAGDNSTHITLTQGETYKVMTGSMLPQNTQAVIQIEMAQEQQGKVSFPSLKQPLHQGLNIRYKGEEIQADSLLLRKGKRLNHLDLSILASQGISETESFVPLKIGIFSSGDEVIEPHQHAKAYQIYNTNATSLYTLLASRGFACSYQGILQDDKLALHKKIESFQSFDVVITSGGASVGDADLIKQALLELGAKFIFDGVNIKPGRHLAIATLGDTIIILLPGNPLALLLHTHTLILPILESLQGGSAFYPKSFTFELDSDLNLKANTTSALLGIIESSRFLPYNNGKIGSSSLATMWKNNAIALFDNPSQKPMSYAKGSAIKVIMYNADFCDIMDFFND